MDAWNDKADMSQAGKTLEAGLPCNVEKTVVYRTSAFYHTHVSSLRFIQAGAMVQAGHSPKPTGGEDCRIACTDPKARFHTVSHPCGRFFVRVGNITKDVVPSNLDLSIYAYDGIWRQSFLRHQVDLQEVELDALPILVAADLVEVCAVYGGVSRVEGRPLLMGYSLVRAFRGMSGPQQQASALSLGRLNERLYSADGHGMTE
ncbi:hypothetical protein EDD85DRAFT_959071 [Armillaria nabsnona]|nr:hypothetical protein EDD85DRAFT_959071 [Armillaria nabsnona]